MISVLSRSHHAYSEILEVGFATSDGETLVREAPETTVLLADPDLVIPVLGSLPRLRWLQSTWAGVEKLVRHIPEGVILTRVAGVFGPQMRDYVFGFLLAHERDHARHREAQARREWEPLEPGGLEGKVLGVLGTGSIGAAIGLAGRAFGMEVRGWSRRGGPSQGFDLVFPAERLLEMADGVDHLVSVLPSTPETEGVVSSSVFGRMRPGGVFVNVGRGSAIDERSLLDGLDRGAPARAVLDVFEVEPLPTDHPFWGHPGVMITPHVAAVSRPSDIADVFLRNLERFEAGQPLEGVVDRGAGY